MMNLLPAISFWERQRRGDPFVWTVFSPYFDSPKDFGMQNVRPLAP
jgi:hypothetical protein